MQDEACVTAPDAPQDRSLLVDVVVSPGQINDLHGTGPLVTRVFKDRPAVFSNGFACVELNGKFGFINKNGEIVVPIKYIKTKDFVNNKSKVVLGYGYFEVDSSGKEVKISKGEFDKNEVSLIPEIPKKVSKFRVQKKLQQTQNAANSNQTNSNISVSSFALDLFSELGSMALYDGSTMYVVKVKGKTMQDQGSVAARATQVLGFSKALKYQWFAGNNCTTLTSKYSSVFTVICQGEIDLNK